MFHKSILRRCFFSRSAQVAGLLFGFITVWLMLASAQAQATSSGTLVAWGDNSEGQTTGTPTLTAPFYATANPVTLNGQTLSGVTAISAGGFHTVALKSDGTVVAWGGNTDEAARRFYGQATVPAGLTGVTAISAGGFHTVALKSDGTVVAWGAGMTDTGCFSDCGQSIVPAGLSGVTAIAAGRVHTVALKSDGTVVAWGAIGYDLGQTSVPAELSGVTAIAAGAYHNLALKNDGTVVAWGWNDWGQTNIPAGLSGVTAIAAGYLQSVALKDDGTVVVWGENGGIQTIIPAGLSEVTAIAANFYDTQALKSDGTVVAWGYNALGAATTPAGLSGVTSIAAGYFHTVALVTGANGIVEITVTIDIKPGSFPNSINPRNRGRIPVAILTTDTFDATTVDATTVRFGATGTEALPVHSALEDVDGDGDTDMILHFNTQATGIQCGDTSASLTGETLDGQMIQGSDAINTVGCK